jgi:hypothetical protein
MKDKLLYHIAHWDCEKHKLFYDISPVGPWMTQVAVSY